MQTMTNDAMDREQIRQVLLSSRGEMFQLAQRLGLNRTLVTWVLRGDNHKVNDKTAKRILRAARIRAQKIQAANAA